MADLNGMLIFIKVVEAKSFTKGGKLLGMPKSTVSRKISELEERLGVRLLERSTRQIRLTEVGTAYYERCTRVISDAEEADRAAAALINTPQGTLRLSAPPLFGDLFLGKVIARYLQQYPQVRVESFLTQHMVNLIEDGFDLSIRVGELPDSSLVARQLGTTEGSYCASPLYFKSHPEPKHPNELKEHDCLLLTTDLSPSAQWRFNNEHGKAFFVQVDGRLQANSFAVNKAAALAGLGITPLPIFMCAKEIREGTLVPVLQPYAPKGFPISVVYPSRRHLSSKVRAFVDLLLEEFQPTPPWLHLS